MMIDSKNFSKSVQLLDRCRLDKGNFFALDGAYLFGLDLTKGVRKKDALDIHMSAAKMNHIPSLFHLIKEKNEGTVGKIRYSTGAMTEARFSSIPDDWVRVSSIIQIARRRYKKVEKMPEQWRILVNGWESINENDVPSPVNLILKTLRKLESGDLVEAASLNQLNKLLNDREIKNPGKLFSNIPRLYQYLDDWQTENPDKSFGIASREIETINKRLNDWEIKNPGKLSEIESRETEAINKRLVELYSDNQQYLDLVSYNKDGMRKIPKDFFLKKLSGTL